MQLKGKKILLTGATGGIGRAIAKALSDEGAILILTARDNEQLIALKDSIGNQPHHILSLDLNNEQGRRKLADVAEQEQVDILINNAGVNRLSLLESTDDAEISQMMNTNLVVPMMLCREIVKMLRHRPESAIVNIGSIFGSIGYAGSASYCASKFGLRGFTEALRREVADSSVKIIYFAPRATDTPLNSDKMNALNKALGNAVDSPEYVAQRLVKALHDDRPHSYFLGWPEAFFVRLNALLPKLVDNALLKQLPVIRRFAQ